MGKCNWPSTGTSGEAAPKEQYAGIGINPNPIASGGAEYESFINYREPGADEVYPAFWRSAGFDQSPDWSLSFGASAGTFQRINGIGQSEQQTVYRYNVQGDFDVSGRFFRSATHSIGFSLIECTMADPGISKTRFVMASLKMAPGSITAFLRTNASVVVATNTDDAHWLRIRRKQYDYEFYYKKNQTDLWTKFATLQDTTGGNGFIAYPLSFAFDTCTDGWIDNYVHFDSRTPVQSLPHAPSSYGRGSASNVQINPQIANMQTVNLYSNITGFEISTNYALPEQMICIRFIQDSTGGRTVNFNGVNLRFGSIAAPTITPTANKTDYVLFIYNTYAAKWDCIGLVQNL